MMMSVSCSTGFTPTPYHHKGIRTTTTRAEAIASGDGGGQLMRANRGILLLRRTPSSGEESFDCFRRREKQNEVISLSLSLSHEVTDSSSLSCACDLTLEGWHQAEADFSPQ